MDSFGFRGEEEALYRRIVPEIPWFRCCDD